MRSFSSVWILIATVCGAVYGARGYNAESIRGLFWLTCFLAVGVTLAAVFSPVVVRVNHGRWDRRQARADAAQAVGGGLVLSALMLIGAGVYWLAGAATGGWQGNWLHAAIGAVIGAIVGLSARFIMARLHMFGRLGIHDHEPARDTVPGSNRT